MRSRTVALLAYDGGQVLDLTGPAEVFWVADQLAGGGAYRVVVVSADGRDTISASGMRMGVQAALGDVEGPIDTFVVPGTPDWARLMEHPPLLRTLSEATARSTRVAAVCAGAFLVGAVGLLQGRRATTHWMFLDDLAERFPGTIVERDPIFVGDGEVFTSAGVTAGITSPSRWSRPTTAPNWPGRSPSSSSCSCSAPAGRRSSASGCGPGPAPPHPCASCSTQSWRTPRATTA